MGTSSHNPGQSGHSPLVPSWVDDGNTSELATPIAPNADSARFSAPKGNMTRFAGNNSSGSGNLRSAASQYVRSSTGGARNAVIRLGSARSSTAKLLGAIGAFSSGGASRVQKFLETYNLVGKRADYALVSIADLICPDGGTTNEGIVRDAYIDTIAETPELRTLNFEDLTPDQLMVVLKGCIARVVLGKMLNDIGNKVLSVPESLLRVKNLKDRMLSFVKGIVGDAFLRLGIQPSNINQRDANQLTDNIYEQVYSIFSETDR